MSEAIQRVEPPKIAGYEVHPAAARLPMMDDAELAQLMEKIKAHGQREKAVLLEGKLLDGRNRGRACELAGLQLQTREATAEECAAPLSFVFDANLHRRHLNESQRALLAAEALPQLREEARERQRATLKRGADLPSVPQGTDGGAPRQEAPEQPPPAPDEATPPARGAEVKGRATEIAATKAGVSGRSVARAQALIEQAPPEVVEEVRAGKTTLKRAEKNLRRAKQIEQVKAYVQPEGKYPVIVEDPEWPFEDELSGDGARAGLPYPTSTVEEICARKIPAAEDCLYCLWTTNTHLLDGSALKVLTARGASPKTLVTWDKGRIGAGRWLRNQTEHCIIAVIGKPMVELKAQSTLLRAPPAGHSEKPQAFYDMIAGLCPARPLLELNARKPREGWVTTGAELDTPSPSLDRRNSSGARRALLDEAAKAADALSPADRTAAAKVGINALVDEATGYQDTRPKDDLREMFRKERAKELLPWSEFLDEVAKLPSLSGQLGKTKGQACVTVRCDAWPDKPKGWRCTRTWRYPLDGKSSIDPKHLDDLREHAQVHEEAGKDWRKELARRGKGPKSWRAKEQGSKKKRRKR